MRASDVGLVRGACGGRTLSSLEVVVCVCQWCVCVCVVCVSALSYITKGEGDAVFMSGPRTDVSCLQPLCFCMVSK